MKCIDLTLDHPRHLGYGWRDAEDLSRRLGGLSLQGMLTKLGELDPGTLTQFLWTGLRNFDKSLTYERTQQLIQSYLDDGKRVTDLLGFVLDALNVCGVIRVREEESNEEAPPGDTPRPLRAVEPT